MACNQDIRKPLKHQELKSTRSCHFLSWVRIRARHQSTQMGVWWNCLVAKDLYNISCMADFTRLFSLFIMHFVVAQLQGKEHLEPKFCNLGKYTIFSCNRISAVKAETPKYCCREYVVLGCFAWREVAEYRTRGPSCRLVDKFSTVPG